MPRLYHSRIQQLRDILEKLYEKYNRFELIKPDPLQFVYRYSDRRDMEIAGFLAASLAYGRVRQIEASVDKLLNRMEAGPYEFVMKFNGKCRNSLKDFRHRFNSGDDISGLLELLGDVIREHGSLEEYFMQGYESAGGMVVGGLSNFCNGLLDRYKQKHRRDVPKGLIYLLSDPAKGSACKRLNLFLRWMVRDDDVDTGLWQSMNKAELIVPVDVHMARLCRFLKLYERKSVSLSAALEITQAFAKIEPCDPVKYDFALSRIGIIEDCNGAYRPQCEDCELLEFCKQI